MACLARLVVLPRLLLLVSGHSPYPLSVMFVVESNPKVILDLLNDGGGGCRGARRWLRGCGLWTVDDFDECEGVVALDCHG